MSLLREYIRELLEANEYGWSTANKKNFMLDKDGMEKSDKKNVHKYLKDMQLMENKLYKSVGSPTIDYLKSLGKWEEV